MFFRLLLAGGCMLLIALAKLDIPGASPIEQTALFVLVIVAADALIAVIVGNNDDFLRKALFVGLLFGAGAALIGGISYALPGNPERAEPVGRAIESTGFTPRYVRVVVISSFIGAALSLCLQSLLSTRLRGGSSLGRRNVVALGGLALIAVITTLAVSDTVRFGTIVDRATFHLVDWIGTGVCVTRDPAECTAPQLRDIGAWDIATILLIYTVLMAARYAYRLRLSAGALILTASGLLTALYACLLAFTLLSKFGFPVDSAGRASLQNLPVWILIWVAFVFAMFRLLLWTRQSALVDALAEAYETAEALSKMLEARLPGRAVIAGAVSDARGYAQAVVQRAEWEGWLDQLVVNARFSRPEDLGLARFADSMGLGVEGPSKKNIDRVAEHLGIDAKSPTDFKLQKIIERSDIVNGAEWRQRMAVLERCVCRVEVERDDRGAIVMEYGTGFLVGPDLVLTAFHVVFDANETEDTRRSRLGRTRCRFDYKQTSLGAVSNGTLVDLEDTVPCVSYSPPSKWDINPQGGTPGPEELDFALLRLARKIGIEPIGGDEGAPGQPETGAPKRGWVNIAAPQDNSLLSSEIIWILQHPRAGALKQAVGRVLDVIEHGRRIRHDADTLAGSSGSPCFSMNDLRPLGMHHAGVDGTEASRPYNQAVGIAQIVELAGRSFENRSWPSN